MSWNICDYEAIANNMFVYVHLVVWCTGCKHSENHYFFLMSSIYLYARRGIIMFSLLSFRCCFIKLALNWTIEVFFFLLIIEFVKKTILFICLSCNIFFHYIMLNFIFRFFVFFFVNFLEKENYHQSFKTDVLD